MDLVSLPPNIPASILIFSDFVQLLQYDCKYHLIFLEDLPAFVSPLDGINDLGHL